MGSIREQWLIFLSTPLYVIVVGIELILSHLHARSLYEKKDTFANFYLMLLNTGIDLAFRIVYLAVLQFFFIHAIFSVRNAVAYWVLLVVAEDFIYYWLHRFDHEVRFFWATHVTHHSSRQMNFTVGFRSSVFQPLYRFIYFIPLAWFGFRPLDIAFVYSATQIWGIFVHTELVGKLGWLEYFMVTPSHHRVHHGSNPKYLDKNMGMFLIIWDKLFGTFQRELPPAAYEPIRYGLTKNIEHPGAVDLVIHEWRDIRRDLRQKGLTAWQKWNYLFGPPGWSHDGSRKTSRQLRGEEPPDGIRSGEPPIEQLYLQA